MNKQQFAKSILIIFEDRNLKIPSEDWLNSFFDKIKNIPDDKLISGFNKIMQIPAQEWNQRYGFGGRPAINDWLEFFNHEKSLTPEKEASLEIAKVMDYANYYFGNSVDFGNPFTNAAVKAYGGIKKLAWDIDKDNDNKRQREWVVKELRALWLDSYEGKKGDLTPCQGLSKPSIFHNGQFIEQEIKIDFINQKKLA